MGDYDVNDPFYLVREEIQDSANKLKKLAERWDRLPEVRAWGRCVQARARA